MNKKLKYATGLLLLAFGRYPISWFVSSKKIVSSPEKLQADESYWIKCDNGNSFYVEFDGPKDHPVLVFIHGLNTSLLQWYYQRVFFRNNYRLLFIDLPGHGQSPKPANLSIAILAKGLKTVLDYFEVKNPVIYGHSMGGMVAMEYCRQNQHNLNLTGMILQHTTYTNAFKTARFASFLQLIQIPILIPFFNFVKRHSPVFHFFNRINYFIGISSLYHRYIFFTGKQTSQQLRFASNLASMCQPGVVAEGMLAAMKFEIGSFLPQITIPTLVIGAQKDRITQYQASVYIHRQIKNSILKSVKEGHMSLIENPQEINQAVQTFLKSINFF